ncbi:hypothetical protein GBA52_001661 [Prunus armeniaca]|nr:hypothetical protein GBA52_001661 [Prunus armeniaca]
MDLGLQHIQLELDAQAAIWMAFQCDADLGYEGVLAASSSFMQVISFSVGFDGLGWAYAPLPTQNKAKLATHD